MPGLKTLFGLLAAIVLLAAPGPAAAQSAPADLYTFTATLMGGLGGSIDEDQAGYDNPAVQVGFSMITGAGVELGARVGTLGFGSTEILGRLLDVDLTYATVAGEYTFGEAGYQSGVFLGLGVYRLEGLRLFTGQPVSTSRFGVTVGASAEFDVTKRVGVVGELSGHLIPGGEVEVFATGLVGLALYIR